MNKLKSILIIVMMNLSGLVTVQASSQMAFDVPVFMELNAQAESLSQDLLRDLGSRDRVAVYLRTRGFQDARVMALQNSVVEFVKSSPFSPDAVHDIEFKAHYFSLLDRQISSLLRFALLNVATLSQENADRAMVMAYLTADDIPYNLPHEQKLKVRPFLMREMERTTLDLQLELSMLKDILYTRKLSGRALQYASMANGSCAMVILGSYLSKNEIRKISSRYIQDPRGL